MFLRWTAALALAASGFFAGCSDDGATPPDLSVEALGPHPVGTVRFVTDDAAGTRILPLQIWYPARADAAATAATGFPIEEIEADLDHRAAYAGLLAAADPACPSRRAFAAREATPAVGPFPLVAVSHCHECTRFSTETVAERLASHGFVVIAVDHVGNTLWNQLAGDGLPLDGTTLALRVADLRLSIDRMFDGTLALGTLGQAIDPARIGVMGHSFGAVTAGKVAQDDARVDAALALAAPMENPLLPGATVASIAKPLGFLLAREDNSITELGNGFIRNNFTAATAGAWKAEVADAGHWSVSDLVGVVDGFDPGCGAGTRQTDGQPFTYLDAATGRAITAAYATAFFRAYLQDDAGARAYLATPRPAAVVTVELK